MPDEVKVVAEVMNGGEASAAMEFLWNLKKGAVLAEIGQNLKEVCTAVQNTGKLGALTITLKIKPLENSDGAVTIDVGLTTKMPKPTLGVSIFYVDDDGSLHRDDPKQMSLRLEKEN